MLARIWRHLVREDLQIVAEEPEPECTATEVTLVDREVQTIPRVIREPIRGARNCVVLTLPHCSRCHGNMTLRRNADSGEFFLGCSRFPRCHSTCNLIINHV